MLWNNSIGNRTCNTVFHCFILSDKSGIFCEPSPQIRARMRKTLFAEIEEHWRRERGKERKTARASKRPRVAGRINDRDVDTDRDDGTINQAPPPWPPAFDLHPAHINSSISPGPGDSCCTTVALLSPVVVSSLWWNRSDFPTKPIAIPLRRGWT